MIFWNLAGGLSSIAAELSAKLQNDWIYIMTDFITPKLGKIFRYSILFNITTAPRWTYYPISSGGILTLMTISIPALAHQGQCKPPTVLEIAFRIALCLNKIFVYEQFSLQPAHPCFKIDHVGSSGKFPYMFPMYMVITSENKKIIWKVVFKILTYFAKIRALFRHLFGRNADIW